MPKVAPKGQVVIPVKLRKRYGLEPGSLVVFTPSKEGVLVKPSHSQLRELKGKYARVPYSKEEFLRERQEEKELE